MVTERIINLGIFAYRASPVCCSDEPRYLLIETQKCSNLGISLVGGNAVGIYVHSVQTGSLAYEAGLRYILCNTR